MITCFKFSLGIRFITFTCLLIYSIFIEHMLNVQQFSCPWEDRSEHNSPVHFHGYINNKIDNKEPTKLNRENYQRG